MKHIKISHNQREFLAALKRKFQEVYPPPLVVGTELALYRIKAQAGLINPYDDRIDPAAGQRGAYVVPPTMTLHGLGAAKLSEVVNVRH